MMSGCVMIGIALFVQKLFVHMFTGCVSNSCTTVLPGFQNILECDSVFNSCEIVFDLTEITNILDSVLVSQ